MNKTYIMLKDVPVLEIEDYRCKILNYELLPISLRYPDVNYDDVMHGQFIQSDEKSDCAIARQ